MYDKKPTQNPRVLKDLLKTKWLKEIEKDCPKIPKMSGLLKWQMKSRKYYVKNKYIMLLEVY